MKGGKTFYDSFFITVITSGCAPPRDENGGAQWSMINGQFSMGERHATRNTQLETRRPFS